MKVYEVVLKPLSGFGTPLKGDTVFGHVCWQIAHDDQLANSNIEYLLAMYHEKPFAVFSSAVARFFVDSEYCYAFAAPALPIGKLPGLQGGKREIIEKRKELKQKKWLVLRESDLCITLQNAMLKTDQELGRLAFNNLTGDAQKQAARVKHERFVITFSQQHNRINRLTGTTGEGGFAPFSVEQQVYFPYPETDLSLFVGVDESQISIDQMTTALERIGAFGYGKDASTGLGRFEIGEVNEKNLFFAGNNKVNACYTLSPCLPDRKAFSEMYFAPFTRFGRHGDIMAKSSNPFKAPVIMADEGGVFVPRDRTVFDKPYMGQAITGISKVHPKAVCQGYSLYLPVKFEV